MDNDFSLTDLISTLSQPELGDLSVELDRRIYRATFPGAGLGSMSRDGYHGRAVRLPLDLLARDLNMGFAAAGGNLAGKPKSMHTDALRGFSVAADSGMQMIDWPVGNLPSVPAISEPIEFGFEKLNVDDEGFRAEGAAVRDADIGFSAEDAKTYTVGVTVKVSRKLIKQGGKPAEMIIRRELLRLIGERIDHAVLSGRGAAFNEPDGLCNRAGVNETDGTDIGLFGATAYTQLMGQPSSVRFENIRAVLGSAAALTMRVRSSGVSDGALFDGQRIRGVPAVPTGACERSQVVFGDFSQAAVLIHGGIEIVIDPRFNFGAQHRFTALADIAVIVPQPKAFQRVINIT